MHVVAASGYNVTVIAEAAMSLTEIISRRKAAGIVLVTIWFYVLLTGAQPPIFVRAGISGSLVVFSWIAGGRVLGIIWIFIERGSAINGVALVDRKCVVSIINGGNSGCDIWGTKAVDGICAPVIEKIGQRPLLLGVWSNLVTTAVAMVAVAPLSWIYFGKVSDGDWRLILLF